MPIGSGPYYIDDSFPVWVNMHLVDGNHMDADSPPTYRVYEGSSGSPILTGTLTLKDASNTEGLYGDEFFLYSTTGFEVGKSYAIRFQAQVDGVVGAHVDMFKIIAAPTSSDPWTTALPGSYGAGTAGKILGDLSSSMATVISSLSTVASSVSSLVTSVATLLTRLPSAITLTGGKVTPIDSEDGIGFARWQRAMMAKLLGKTVITGGGTGATFKDQDNVDTVTNTYDATAPRGKRTGSSILPP